MRWFRLIPICFVAIVLGCGGIGGRIHDQQLVGGVGLFATDTREEMCVLDFDRGGVLVPATVFAVGWDESHLIAKRHPPSPTDMPNYKEQTEYFIVVIQGRKAYGPFDRDEYAMHCDILGVAENLDFSLTFRDLE